MKIFVSMRQILVFVFLSASTQCFALQVIYFDTSSEAETFCHSNTCLHTIDLSQFGKGYRVIFEETQEEPPEDDTPPENSIYSLNKGLYFFDKLDEVSAFCEANNCIGDVAMYPNYSPNPPYESRRITVYIVQAYYSRIQRLKEAPTTKTTDSLRDIINLCYLNPSIRCAKLVISAGKPLNLSYGRVFTHHYPAPTPKPIKPGEEKPDT